MPDPSPADETRAELPLRLGISACLLGEEVRFDGGHKRDRFLVGELGRYVEWVQVCPEVGVGMGTPRESVRLEGDVGAPRMVGGRSGRDWTDAMRRWSEERLEQLAELDLHGFVLKKNSPSCGLYRVRVYADTGVPAKDGRGLFADELCRRLPHLPTEEEGRLNDPRLRENFIDRAFTYARLGHTLREEPTPRGLIGFHTRHKYTVLAHSTPHYKALGRIVARAGETPWKELVASYTATLMEGMAAVATPGRNTNVLEHLAGHVKDVVDAGDRAELHRTIHEYRRGLVPLVVPLALLRHHFRRHPDAEWARRQTFLDPYPADLVLRNRV